MVSVDRVLSEFIDAWNAGRRPRVEEYLARVEPHRRDELADEISTWMEVAPTPAYDEAALEAIRDEPAVRAAQDAFGTRSGLWPALLPRLRARAQLSVDALAERLAARLGFAGRETKVRRYVGEMEQGSLDATRVSTRVLEALGTVLGVSAEELRRTGALSGPAPAAATSAAFFRAEGAEVEQLDRLEVVADAMLARAPEEWDEVDEAFQSGDGTR
jgi:transcriptional regulator with XRE-family HTH domain